MRVLIQAPEAPRHLNIAVGWWNALTSSGHEARLWDPDQLPAFDAFDAFRPELLLENRARTRAVERALVAHPGCRAVDISGAAPAFDAIRWGQGVARPEYEADVVFVGDARPEKRPLLEAYLGPLLADPSIRVRLHGRTCWGGEAYCGWVGDAALADVYASAKVGLNISQGRTSERFYQIGGIGGCLVTNVDMDGRPASPEWFLDDVRYRLDDAGRRDERRSDLSFHFRRFHTYHHRVAAIFREIGLGTEAERVLSHAVQP